MSTLTLRPGQKYLEDKILEYFNLGYEYGNVDACVRVGKSLLSLSVASKLGYFPVYIGKNLTSQSSVVKDQSTFNVVPDFLTLSLHGGTDHKEKADRLIDTIKSRVKNQKVIFFVDEVDDSSHTVNSIKVLTLVIQEFRSKRLFGGLITMTGTRAYRGNKVLKSVNPQAKTFETRISYYELQKLQPESTVRRNFKNITIYSPKTKLSNISESMKNNAGRTDLGKAIMSVVKKNNAFSIKYDTFPHVFIKISTVGKERANLLVNALNGFKDKSLLFVNINGDFTNSSKAELFCKQIIVNNPSKRIVFVTQGMATTSFSVPEIGTTMVITDNEMSADDIQAIHRSCTWVEGKTDANLILLTTNDSKELRYDDIFEPETGFESNRTKLNKVYKEILENNSIVHYLVDGGDVKISDENISTMIDKKLIANTEINSLTSLIDSECFDFFDFNHVDPMATTSRKTTKEKDNKPKNKEGESNKKENKAISNSEREKICRRIGSEMSIVSALNGVQNKSIYDVDTIDWAMFEITRSNFCELIDMNDALKERMEVINGLCKNSKYFIDVYLPLVLKLNNNIKIQKHASTPQRVKVEKNALYIYSDVHIQNLVKEIKDNSVIITTTNLSPLLWDIIGKGKLPTDVEFYTLQEYMNGDIDNMKFDFAVGNPPYQGNAQLHQRIFNKTVGMLKDGGQLTFIQPATPYQNKKESGGQHNDQMVENIKLHDVEVEFVHGSVFEEAAIFTDLAITTLTKKAGKETIDEVTMGGATYKDVHIEDVSMTKVPPSIYRSIREKFKSLVNKNGSLSELLTKDQKVDVAPIASIRGNVDMKNNCICANFYTFFSPVDYEREHGRQGIKCKKEERENVYTYLATKTARYGLSMLKINQNIIQSDLELVPIVDFSKAWTDDELFDVLGLTNIEIQWIGKVITDYNHANQTN